VKIAENSKSREVKLSIEQAKNLAFTIGIVMSRMEGDLEQLVANMKKTQNDEVINVKLDGGGNWK